MSPLTALHTLLLIVVCPLALAQNVDTAPSRYAASLVQPVSVDAQITAEVDTKKKKFESIVREYLVAFNSSHDGQNQARVGLPLAAFAQNLIHVAYDLKDNSVMMQWKFSQLTKRGVEWNFNAFLSQTQTAAIVVSANF